MQWDINDTDDTNNKKGQKIIISNRLKEEENKYLERERTPRSQKKTITTQTTTMKWFLESDHVEAIYIPFKMHGRRGNEEKSNTYMITNLPLKGQNSKISQKIYYT